MQAISSANVSGFAGELAVLQIENDDNQAQTSRLQRDAARQSYLDQAQQQVEALHAAADATSAGAFVNASLTLASGACQIGAASFQFEAEMGPSRGSCVAEIAGDRRTASVLADIANTCSKLADPMKALIGDSTAEHRQADAKQHEMLAAQAQWQASDASTEIDKAEKRAEKTIDLVQNIQRDQNAATNSLIGRI